jgi:hypothetical protein
MSSGAPRTISKSVSVAPQPVDPARLDRALDRLAAHCEVVGRMSAPIDQRRPNVQAQLERELGPELTRTLLAGLVAPA